MAFIVEMINLESNKIQMRATFWTWPKDTRNRPPNGWTPTGTVLENTLKNPTAVISDYEPDSRGPHALKVFTAEDAANLADVLERAGKRKYDGDDSGTPALMEDKMNKEKYDEVNGPVSREFIDFLR